MRRQEARVRLAEVGGHRVGPRHREHGAGGRQDGRLGRGQRRGQDGQDDQLVPRRAEDAGRQGTEDGVVVGELLRRSDAAERDHGGRGSQVGHEKDDRARDGGETGSAFAVLRLLRQVDRALPAPVDEHPDQETTYQGAGAIDREGREPGKLRDERAFRGRASVHPHQGHDGEQQERPDLGDDHDVLDAGGDLGAYNAEGRHSDDEDDGEQGDRHLRAGEAVEAEEQVSVAGGHVGQRANDQDAGHADRPAPDPTRPTDPSPASPTRTSCRSPGRRGSCSRTRWPRRTSARTRPARQPEPVRPR